MTHLRLLFLLVTASLIFSTALDAQRESLRDFAPIKSRSDKRDVLNLDSMKDEIKRRFPRVRFDGSMKLRDIKSPSDKAERFDYTLGMMDLVEVWLALDMGTTLKKVIDEQFEARRTDVCYLVIASHFALLYDGFAAEDARETVERGVAGALEIDPEFVPALYMKAIFFDHPLLSKRRASNAREAMKTLRELRKHRTDYDEANFLLAKLLTLHTDQFDEAKTLISDVLKNARVEAPVYIGALQLFRYLEKDNAKAALNELLKSVKAKSYTALIQRSLAEIALNDKDYENAIELGLAAIAMLDPKRDASTMIKIRLDVVVGSLFELYSAARKDESVAEGDEKAALATKMASFRQRIESQYKEAMVFDVAHLSPLDVLKSLAANEYAAFLRLVGEDKKALAVLIAYDTQASPLSSRLRAALRTSIDDLKTYVEGSVNLVVLKEYQAQGNMSGLALELAKLAVILNNDSLKLKLNDKEVISYFTSLAGDSNRMVASVALELCGFCAAQVADDETKSALLEAIIKRMTQDIACDTAEQRQLVNKGFEGLMASRTRASLAAALDQLEALAPKLDGPDRSFRSSFANYLRTTSELSDALLDKKISYRASTGQSERRLKRWTKKVRDELAKAK